MATGEATAPPSRRPQMWAEPEKIGKLEERVYAAQERTTLGLRNVDDLVDAWRDSRKDLG